MSNDILARHRKAENRDKPNAFEEKLIANCHHVVPHEKLRQLSEDNKKIIEELVKD